MNRHLLRLRILVRPPTFRRRFEERRGLVLLFSSLKKIKRTLGPKIQGEVKGRSIISEEEDLMLERQLKTLNKPSIKTFKADNGDTIDCVDIHKQPALDHPLLKNHKVLMQPSSYPKSPDYSSTTGDVEFAALKTNVECTHGSVPIKRITKEYLIRAKAFTKAHSESLSSAFHINTGLTPGLHPAIVRSKYERGNKYYGIQGTLNVYQPYVGNISDHYSASHIGIQSGRPEVRNYIQIGWMVSPALHGDHQPRIFECTDVNRPGYVGVCSCPFGRIAPSLIITNPRWILGAPLEPSIYGNTSQIEITFRIAQDIKNDAWWFELPDHDIIVGYWPSTGFPLMGDGCDQVTWGGIAMGDSNGACPQMGSGHFPDGSFVHGCYVRRMYIVDGANILTYPEPPKCQTETFVDGTICYDIARYGWNGKLDQYSFLFGGSGGPNCGA